MNDLISVVVPVYNVKKYLEECVDSIINQSYKDLEILLIDDGSTDGSSDLCDTLKKKDQRIKVFHKTNGGLSDARNYGIKKSSGKYIVFVDSDDVLSPNLVKKLYDMIQNNSAGIAIVDLKHFYDGEEIIFEECDNSQVLSSEDAICDMLYQKSFLVSVCGKMFKRTLFDDIMYPKDMLYEDSAIMYKLLDKTESIVYDNSKLYGYRHRKNSITTNNFSLKNLDIITISDEIVNYFINHSEELQKASLAYRLNSHFRIFLTIPDGKEFAEYKKNSDEYIKKNYKDVLKDKNVRKKMRFAIYCYVFCKPFLRFIYSHIDRWK